MFGWGMVVGSQKRMHPSWGLVCGGEEWGLRRRIFNLPNWDPSLDSSIGSTLAWYHVGNEFKSWQGRGFKKNLNLTAS